jgi:Tfp pilus assembly protein PilV
MNKGLSLVEIIVAVAIVVTVVVTGAEVFQYNLKLSNHAARDTQIALITEEAAEVLQFMRDTSWAANIGSLSNGTVYYLYWSTTTNSYATSTVPIAIAGAYTAKITLSAVNRDVVTSDIVESGGNTDAGTRKAAITISTLTNPGEDLLTTNILIHDIFSN